MISLLDDKMNEETLRLTLKERPEPNLETRISFTLTVGYFHWACKQPRKALQQLHSNMGYSHLSNHPYTTPQWGSFAYASFSHIIFLQKIQVSSFFLKDVICENWKLICRDHFCCILVTAIIFKLAAPNEVLLINES